MRIALVSGKGGTGKSVIAAALARHWANPEARVLLADGAIGLSDLEINLGLRCEVGLTKWLRTGEGAEQLSDGLDFVAGAVGSEVELLPPGEEFKPVLEARTADYQFVVLDTLSGVGPHSVSVAAAADRVVVVLTPEPSSLVDSARLVSQLPADMPVAAIVNLARPKVAAELHERFQTHLAHKYNRYVPLLGSIPPDPKVLNAVQRREPLGAKTAAAKAIACLAEKVRGEWPELANDVATGLLSSIKQQPAAEPVAEPAA